MSNPPTRRWITVKETAELFGLSVGGVRKLINRNRIPAVHLGRAVRIDKSKLEKLLDAQCDQVIEVLDAVHGLAEAGPGPFPWLSTNKLKLARQKEEEAKLKGFLQ